MSTSTGTTSSASVYTTPAFWERLWRTAAQRLAGQMGFAEFTALTGAVSSYPLLLLTRFSFGAGEAGANPNAAASIASWFPASERGRAFGVLAMAMQTGGSLSPLLVVPIQIRYGWRASFYVFALWGWFGRSFGSSGSETPLEKSEASPVQN